MLKILAAHKVKNVYEAYMTGLTRQQIADKYLMELEHVDAFLTAGLKQKATYRKKEPPPPKPAQQLPFHDNTVQVAKFQRPKATYSNGTESYGDMNFKRLIQQP